jgi:hypothetical protein
MTKRDIRMSETQSLANLMYVDPDAQELWETGELGAILEHQLDAPLEFDLIGVGAAVVGRMRRTFATGEEIRTFGDLLRHPSPPVEILELTKEFAKASRSHADSPLPDEVAAVLYLGSIAAALVRCARRITKLDDEGLRFGLEWALALPWLDDPIRGLIEEARRALKAG